MTSVEAAGHIRPGWGGSDARGWASNDGTVRLGPLAPGTYTVWAKTTGTERPFSISPDRSYWDFDDGPRLGAAAQVELVDRSRNDVVLTLGRAAKASGHVIVNGTPEIALWARVEEVMIGSRGGLGFNSNDPNGRVDADGAFTFEGLMGEGCLNLDVPGSWYIESATYQGRSILRVPIVFEPGAELDGVLFTIARRVPYSSDVPEPCPAARRGQTNKN